MKYLTYILILATTLVMVASCGKDEEIGPYQFSTDIDMQEFMESHDWALMALSFDNSGVDWDIGDNNMLLWIDPEYQGGELDPNDTFSLSINGIDIHFNQEHWDDYGWVYFDHVVLPIASKVDVLFKRNNSVIFDKKVKLSAFPKITSFPGVPNWNDDLILKWSLSRDSHVQMVYADTYSADEHNSVYHYTNPSARSYAVPVNVLFMFHMTSYGMSLMELCFTEYNSAFVVSMTVAGKRIPIDREDETPTSGNLIDRLLKKAWNYSPQPNPLY
ncbi:MAG: hypothetical protein GX122_04960 [Candidatus Cloacimonetes bacterium]|nr:hypothetical protein [Candidatus Cloacimonadota bacterium]